MSKIDLEILYRICSSHEQTVPVKNKICQLCRMSLENGHDDDDTAIFVIVK